MAIPAWPPGLPQSPQKGFSSTGGVNLLRTPVERGPAKQRYISKKPENVSLSFIMTKEQVAILKTFIETTIFGTKRFSFTHPVTGGLVEVRIVPQGEGDLFNLSYLAPDYYTISLNLEVLP